jgi:Holliday junction resolvase RusA-like endonuclease
MPTIRFFVDCPPVAQPRQRHAMIGGHVRNYTPAAHPVNVFKDFARMAAKRAYQGPPLEGPLRLSLLFLLPRPKRMIWKAKPMPREWMSAKPDFDNISKAFSDAMNGIVWVDDSQICSAVVQKMYAAGGESPGVVVEIEELA